MPAPTATAELREAALHAAAWPFDEAKKLLPRAKAAVAAKGYVLFETGYGPSGLPHIGTFAEVARTSMVRHAFSLLSGARTRLFAFSDDMDGLRKAPDNVPNKERLREFLGLPLTKVPDPFGCHESFGHHNNAKLRSFLDEFGFDYEFVSSTDMYMGGKFDKALLRALACHDEIVAIVAPTLGPERRATYSPFLPISPKTGHVLQVPVSGRDPKNGTIRFHDECGEEVEVPVTGGYCKLQWKADWAMRWYALGVDYEMSGKDLISSVELSSRIVRVLGAAPPEGFNYELFLDENGEKISKSKGNGLSVEQWLKYGSPESLAFFMYQKPRTAKKLYFDAIPKAADDYARYLEKFSAEDAKARLENPVWHIHAGNPPGETQPVSFALMLTLVSASSAHTKDVLWGFIRKYAPGANAKDNPALDRLAGYALAYYEDFVKPAKRYRAPSEKERKAFEDLLAVLPRFEGERDAEKIQFEIYEIGKRHKFEPLRDWFRALYEVLFGQEQGPRFGTFVAIYGANATAALVKRALAGEFTGGKP